MWQHLEQQLIEAGIRDGSALLVAVSGGVDSVVLLHLLRRVASTRNLALQVAHLDHRIRAGSEADADFVRDLCRDWVLPCHTGRFDVPALAAAQGVSLEMAARQARRAFLQSTAEQLGCERIVLAHHRDDQLETFLLRLVRGSGLSGLAAMEKLQGPWWRPLLEIGQKEILAYALEQKLRWVEDESNSDPVFLRNLMRHQVVPLLRAINPQLDNRLTVLTGQIRQEEDFWQQQVAAVLPGLMQSSATGLRLSRSGLLGLHPALRLRLLREALRLVRGDLQRIESDHLLAVDHLLLAERSQAQLDLPGCWAARRYDSLWLRSFPPEKVPAFELTLPVPGELELPCGRVLLAVLQDEQGEESARVAEFAYAELPGELRVRSGRSGDRFAPLGMDGHKQLKAFFIDEKVELEDRRRTPLLTCGDEIVWVVGMRRSRLAIPGRKVGKILRLELI